LANALIGQCKVTLVTLRQGGGANAWLNPGVHTICLADFSKNFPAKINHYRALLRESGGRSKVASLSLCLSADFVNIFCKRYASTFCSVRANLFINYRHDYGLAGIGLAFIHLFSLRWIERVIAMNQSMSKQIKKYSGHTSEVIGNFIDEERLNKRVIFKNKTDSLVYVFVGSLTSRKQPGLLIRALRNLIQKDIKAYVEFVGAGPESKKIELDIRKYNLTNFVRLHGFLSDPESIIINADVLVLPSLSEGISRAAMEALYLGIPCVLRDADGNSELVIDGLNGAVFTNDLDLPVAMLRAAEISRLNQKRECLLPSEFRQEICSKKYTELLRINKK
jgi:glycosyltransferase involved in cell wall biosynthesis